MKAPLIIALALVVALLGVTVTLMIPSEADARCTPAYLFAQDPEGPEPIPGGGTATAKAEVRGWIAVGIACFHGEVKSNTTRAIDYINSSGWFYADESLKSSGYDYCYNCTSATWKGKAIWDSGGPTTYKTRGIHTFSEGAWSWQPITEAYYVYYIPIP